MTPMLILMWMGFGLRPQRFGNDSCKVVALSTPSTLAHDPFGKRRATNGSYDAAGAIVVDWSPAVNNGNDRGYTGHEHLDDVGLVHMNGRVFDPRLAVFLQADPVTQDPYNLQGFNRYGYCLNNPLTCTDPSGLSSWTDFRDGFVKPAIAIGVAVMAPEAIGWLLTEVGGAAFGAFFAEQVGSVYVVLTPLGHYTAVATAGFLSGAIASGNMEGALQGAFTAAAFYGAGDLISGTGAFAGTGGVSNQFGQVAIHGVVGCVTSEVGGGKCGPGAASAAFSKFATVNGFVGQDVVSGTITSAVVGGTAAELGGGKFANGAMTAAFGYLFNYCEHNRCWTTSEERALLNRGDYLGYYRAACNGGDPYACQAADIAAGESPVAKATTERLQNFAKQSLGRELTADELSAVRLDIAKGYAAYLGSSEAGGKWPSALAISAQHWAVLDRFGLPPAAFGGTPFGSTFAIIFGPSFYKEYPPPVGGPGWCPKCSRGSVFTLDGPR